MYADIFGLIRESCSMFSVILHWCIISHHLYAGNLLSQPLRLLMKWFIQVWTARSTGLRRWSCGLASQYFKSLDSINSISISNTSLSICCITGTMPAFVKQLYSLSYAVMRSVTILYYKKSCLSFKTTAKIKIAIASNDNYLPASGRRLPQGPNLVCQFTNTLPKYVWGVATVSLVSILPKKHPPVHRFWSAPIQQDLTPIVQVVYTSKVHVVAATNTCTAVPCRGPPAALSKQ